MRKRGAASVQMPSSAQIEAEIKRERHNVRFRRALRRTIITFVLIAAICAGAAYFFLPVLRVHSSSMADTIVSGDILVAVKGVEPEKDDIIAFKYEEKTLVRRVAALPGDEITLDEAGALYINGQIVMAASQSDLETPLIVPQGSVFVLGDNVTEAVDSRNSAMGCIDADSLIGTVYARVWPFETMTMFEPVMEQIKERVGLGE